MYVNETLLNHMGSVETLYSLGGFLENVSVLNLSETYFVVQMELSL